MLCARCDAVGPERRRMGCLRAQRVRWPAAGKVIVMGIGRNLLFHLATSVRLGWPST